jgi:YfiH family protein
MPPGGKSGFWLPAAWPAPGHVRAGITTRAPGHSRPPFAEFNLADHVGDATLAVQKNRSHLQLQLQLPAAPHWLQQTHSNHVVELSTATPHRHADAAYAAQPGSVCAVLTADCLPILVCNRAGTEIAAIHAGWRGLAANIIEGTLARFRSSASEMLAWIGPHISANHYIVGADVRGTITSALAVDTAAAFIPHGEHKWRADLQLIARAVLAGAGITDIHSSGYCTFANPELFYSYRREAQTGRMAALIWIDHDRIG